MKQQAIPALSLSDAEGFLRDLAAHQLALDRVKRYCKRNADAAAIARKACSRATEATYFR